MSRTSTALLGGLGAVALLLLSAVFVVDEREKVLVLQFGQIAQVREEPGLGFKIPFIQEVVRYDDRILSLDTEAIEVTPSDDRRLIVDAFARYRISDVVQFRQAVGAGGLTTAEDRLGSILNSTIREVLGADQVTSDTILSVERAELMTRIRDIARAEASSLGLDIVDVRLKQTNLPEQNLEATFARMRAEREREAADEIARGNEAAQRVRALADRTVTETLSEAEREAQITRGEADAEASSVFAEAFGADPEFFGFYRSMQAYLLALNTGNATMVLTPDNQFLDHLYGDPLAGAGTAAIGTGATAPEAAPEEEAAAPAAEPAAAEEAQAIEGTVAGEAVAAAPEAVEPAAEAEPAAEPVAESVAEGAAGEPAAEAVTEAGTATQP